MIKHLFITLIFLGCASVNINNMTHNHVEVDKFMGTWFVQAGRFTFFERNAFNAKETYTWNEKDQRIDIDFSFNKGSLNGEEKSIPQKGWIYNKETNSHWKVSPFWPLKLDYLVLYVDKEYELTAVGVPNQNYLWIMSRDRHPPKEKIEKVLRVLNNNKYDTSNLRYIEHSKD